MYEAYFSACFQSIRIISNSPHFDYFNLKIRIVFTMLLVSTFNFGHYILLVIRQQITIYSSYFSRIRGNDI